MFDEEDYSGRGYFWQGVDFHKHYDDMHAYEKFYLVGFDFKKVAHDIWKIGDHKSGEKKIRLYVWIDRSLWKDNFYEIYRKIYSGNI